MDQKKPTQNTSPLDHEEEEAHWQTLSSLLKQMPSNAPAQQPASIASKPLLKPASDKSSVVFVRSTAAQFPLPSVDPSTAQQTAQPAAQENTAPANTAPAAAKPISASHSQSAQRKRVTDSWTRKISQHVANTFDDTRTKRSSSVRSGSSGTRTRNQAEVAYNPQGKVDYVTYTFNAPSQKKHDRNR